MSGAISPVAHPVLPWASFGPILAIHFLGTLGFSLAIPFLVFIVTDLGGASWTYGLVGATYSAFQLIGAPVLGRWSDRSGRRPVLVASQVGTLAAWLLFLGAAVTAADWHDDTGWRNADASAAACLRGARA